QFFNNDRMLWRSLGLRQLDQNNTTRRAQPCSSKALDTSVRKLSCILCLCEDVRMTSTGNDDGLDAQDPARLRLLPLWPDLVVSRSRNVHVVDLRQRFQRTNFVEADHGMSG